jgi:hypothetical protein
MSLHDGGVAGKGRALNSGGHEISIQGGVFKDSQVTGATRSWDARAGSELSCQI